MLVNNYEDHLYMLPEEKLNELEEKCKEKLFKFKWPAGYFCNKCGNACYYFISERGIYECKKCHHQESLTAQTFMHKTRIPLSKWLYAIEMFHNANKKSPSVTELVDKIDISYPSAWMMIKKIKNNMNTVNQILLK